MKRKDFLVFGRPVIGKEEIAEVVQTLRSGWWGTGPKTQQFEQEFAAYSRSKYAVAVNSATAGLHLALKVLNLPSGSEVITTPMTFVSTINVILHANLSPVFADVEKDTWNIDPSEIEKKITKKTKAILPVHLHGRPADMKRILKIARAHKLYVIEDAAHAVEAMVQEQKIGSIGDMTVFSFYATKNIATGEGGMITTNNKAWARRLQILRLHGLSTDGWKRYSVKHFKLYNALEPGYKYNLTDIASSLGIHQLRRVEQNWIRRKQIWDAYNQAFSHNPLLMLPAPIPDDVRHGLHLFAFLLKTENMNMTREEFITSLLQQNIGSGVHFFPVHLHPYYRRTFHYKRGNFPHAEYIGDRTVSLPISANMTDRDVRDVIRAVKNILRV